MRSRTWILGVVTSPLVVVGVALAVFGANEATVPNSFSPGTTASSAAVNANFSALATQITDNVPWRTRLDYNNKVQDNSVTTTWELLRTIGTFTKNRASTDVILELSSTRLEINGASGSFQLRIDNVADNASDQGIYIWPAPTPPYATYVGTKAVFKGLAAGVHTVSLWSRSIDGAGAFSENGDNITRTVFVEESPSR